jgi:hypothetical protein
MSGKWLIETLKLTDYGSESNKSCRGFHDRSASVSSAQQAGAYLPHKMPPVIGYALHQMRLSPRLLKPAHDLSKFDVNRQEYGCPAWIRTMTLPIQSRRSCQLHHRA